MCNLYHGLGLNVSISPRRAWWAYCYARGRGAGLVHAFCYAVLRLVRQRAILQPFV